ncbi:hypothetical protein EDB85DRAFT_2144426 [Lactarius pseudohatsudake]|nr:hypothetical protein EDB85DRAFT_2144426 [Lactarius pseudohatsudake]
MSRSVSLSSAGKSTSSEHVKILEGQLSDAMQSIQELKDKCEELKSTSGMWKTHCYFMCDMTKRSNASRVFTAGEGRLELDQLCAEASQKKQQQADGDAWKAAEDEARRKWRADLTREELEDIAAALALLDSGKKDELLERITTFFEEHPDLKTDPRFEGLFSSQPQKPVAGPLNTHGPTLPPPNASLNFGPANASVNIDPSLTSTPVSSHNKFYYFIHQ